MTFNSIEYLLFLPIVFVLYWFVFKNHRYQNFLLVVASYIFYGWWDWRFLLLIAFTSSCSYWTGKNIYRSQIGGGKFYVTLNVVLNLLVLGFFKYYNFFVESLAVALNRVGIQADFTLLHVILPVGISFYTFQALSYTIDVYRKKIAATDDVVSFFAYISFFPQLVAGPIERATSLLPQMLNKRTFDYNQAVDGIQQIVWGLFKKMVVADHCAILVNKIWGDYSHQSSLTLVAGAVLFSFQIYGDFSGYSDIAIGSAKLFGIRLIRNFKMPYFSSSIPEFWKRWHISLNTWFVDYLYIPLGGSRCTKWKWFRNVIIIFVLSGLWHGANWSFLAWGFYHALLFLPFMVLGMTKTKDSIDFSFKRIMSMAVTFVLIAVGWVIFRSESIYEAGGYLSSIILNGGLQSTVSLPVTSFVWIVILMLIEWHSRLSEQPFVLVRKIKYPMIRYSVYLVLAFLVLVFSAPSQEFIYFQF